MQFARINGVVLHHQLFGAGSGRPVLVFANSLGTDFRIWRDVIVRLAGEYTILTYDKRGHGLSDLGNPPYTMDQHVDDLSGLIDHLGLGPAIIVGLSVGGMIAQGLVERRPDLVRGLVLCDTAHKIGDAALWNGRIDAVMGEGGIAGIADAILARWFTARYRAEETEAMAGWRNMLIRQPVEGYAGTCAALRDADYTDFVKTIAVPALCVVGDEDGSTPPDLVLALARLIPGARYEVIPGAGHIPPVEQPALLADMIRALAALVPSGASQ
ncbi:MAG: 3-oxoadipate enol-lactonase [Devosia sp.]